MSKICSSCGEGKPTSSFHKNRRNLDGLVCWCKECVKERGIAYRKANAASIKQRKANYYRANAAHIRQQKTDYQQKARTEAFEAYGGAVCAHCGKANSDCLTLDHVNQDGAKRRRNGERRGTMLYINLRKHGFPPGFRVLCFNCNQKAWRKHKQRSLSESASAYRNREYKKRRKRIVFNAYGGTACALCGETDIDVLSLDHINGKGNEHVAALWEAGYRSGCALYRWSQKNNYPPGFRVLCLNCNCSRESKGELYATAV
jgi:hypothetical protein